MKTTTFKAELKEVANYLKGKTIQLIQGDNSTPYKNLREFGFAVLNEEAAGRNLFVSRVWTNTGSFNISSFEQLTKYLKNEIVTAVTFSSKYVAVDHADYLRNSFGTND